VWHEIGSQDYQYCRNADQQPESRRHLAGLAAHHRFFFFGTEFVRDGEISPSLGITGNACRPGGKY
jgi:hypothetical protein